jgi:hypothetical protein
MFARAVGKMREAAKKTIRAGRVFMVGLYLGALLDQNTRIEARSNAVIDEIIAPIQHPYNYGNSPWQIESGMAISRNQLVGLFLLQLQMRI